MTPIIPPPIVVFVRPQTEGNIGAIARVMSNMNCQELRLVGTHPKNNLERAELLYSMADWSLATKRGKDILNKASWYTDLPSALEDIHFTIGTSGKAQEFERGYSRPLVSANQAFDNVARWYEQHQSQNQNFRWSLLMGSEADGLTALESSHCQKLIHLPINPEAPSINVAMCLGMLLYHWKFLSTPSASETPVTDSGPFLPASKKERNNASEPGRELLATNSEKEKFLSYLMESIEQTKFLKYPDKESVVARLRRWLQIAPVPQGELLLAFEIVYHFRAWGSGAFEKRDFLKQHTNSTQNPNA